MDLASERLRASSNTFLLGADSSLSTLDTISDITDIASILQPSKHHASSHQRSMPIVFILFDCSSSIIFTI